MWILKFKAIHKGCKYTPKVIESNCIVHTYPLGYFRKKAKIYFSAVHTVDGNNNKFVSLLKKDKYFKKIESVGDLIFTLVAESNKEGFYDPFYDPSLFFPRPITVKPDGYEYWEVASWEKKFLKHLLEILQDKKYVSDYKILKFGESDLEEFIFPKIISKLTKKQKEAINLAFREGYYEFPKKVTLLELSKKIKISKQAFQKLLSKAEKHVIPYVI